MSFVYEIDINDTKKIIKRLGLDELGSVQKQIDQSFLDYCDEYLPFDRGALRDSGYSSTTIGRGEIIWNTPYAHYLYEGELYVDPITNKGAFFSEGYGFWSRTNTQKVPSGKELKYHGGGLRGKKWAERMWTDHKEDIIKEAEAVLGKGG